MKPLSTEARALLSAAARGGGQILAADTKDGFSLSAGDQSFCDGADHRTEALFREALSDLFDAGLVRHLRPGGSVLELTAAGYRREEESVMTQDGAFRPWDVFLSHASEDKQDFVEPLARALKDRGVRVWYDQSALRLGDSLRAKIDEGLAHSRYGVVVLSHAFFRKDWPRWELDGLTAREIDGHQLILPVWHGVTREDVTTYSPTLAGRVAARSCDGLERVVDQIIERIDDGRPLGPGLRGRVRVERGHFVYRHGALDPPQAAILDGLTAFIREGTLDRGPDGHLRARIDTLMGTQTMQRFNERMDLAVLCLESAADKVSTDPKNPTVFTNRRTVAFRRGERVPLLFGPGEVPLPSDVTLEASTAVNAVLRGNRFEGTFVAELRASGVPALPRPIRLTGTFEATVA